MPRAENKEYDTFEHNMRELLKVPHSKIKDRLEEEKRAKSNRKKAKKLSAKRQA
jgi:hypothetical protein